MNRLTIALLLALFAVAEGCASTLQAKPAHQSSVYRETAEQGIPAEGMVPHVHGQRKVDWSTYTKVQLDRIDVWEGWSSQASPEDEEALSRLAGSFHDKLVQRLSKDYTMVDRPTPGAMRIDASIVHAERSWVAAAFLSKVSWQLQALNGLWTYVRGKPAFAGEISLEFTVHDSMTGELLFAGTDRRVGGQNLFNKHLFNSWGDVENSLAFWTEQAAYHLCVVRKLASCTAPRP